MNRKTAMNPAHVWLHTELKAILAKHYRLEIPDFCHLTGRRKDTIAAWLAGERLAPQPVVIALKMWPHLTDSERQRVLARESGLSHYEAMKIQAQLALDTEALAELCGVAPSTMARYLTGLRRVPLVVGNILRVAVVLHRKDELQTYRGVHANRRKPTGLRRLENLGLEPHEVAEIPAAIERLRKRYDPSGRGRRSRARYEVAAEAVEKIAAEFEWARWTRSCQSDEAGWRSVLGVSMSATKDEVKAAYRRKAKEHHPDIGGDPEMMREINDAWEQAQTALR